MLEGLSYAGHLMLWDMVSYKDGVLGKVDRASMAHVKRCAPFLDHRMMNFAWSLPMHMKIRDKSGWIVKEMLSRHIPRALWDRPKQGFTHPLRSGCVVIFAIGGGIIGAGSWAFGYAACATGLGCASAGAGAT